MLKIWRIYIDIQYIHNRILEGILKNGKWENFLKNENEDHGRTYRILSGDVIIIMYLGSG